MTWAVNGIGGGQGLLPDYIINTGVTWEYPVRQDSVAVTLNATYVPEVNDRGTLTTARRLAEKAENVRRSDIPAADRANVNTLGPGHEITRRNGTEQIGPDDHRDVAEELHEVNVGAPTSRFQEES